MHVFRLVCYKICTMEIRMRGEFDDIVDNRHIRNVIQNIEVDKS